MAHSNSTTHYSLPQFESTDKPAWLTDINGAFSDIDTGIYNAQDKANDAASDATQALSDASDAATAASAADSKGSGAVASIAAAFDPTATYALNDLVMYNNLLYRCKVAVSNPGPWTGTTNWVRVYIDSQIPHVLANLRDCNVSAPTPGQVLTYTEGGYWSGRSTPKSNILSQISFNEDYANASAYVVDNVVYITYQGENKAHSNNDNIFTINSAYRPLNNQYIPFVVNSNAYGNIVLEANTGNARVNHISSSTVSGRIYVTVAYPL